MGLGVLPGTADQGQQRGPKAFTARISRWRTSPIQQTTERSQDEFGADEHLVPLQALIWRVGSWLGTNQGPYRLHRVKSERTHTTHTRGDERQNKPLLR